MAGIRGHVVAVSIGRRKGEKKTPVPSAEFVLNHGMKGDAHAGRGLRQVSLLARESIAKMEARGLRVGPGDFAENVTVDGLDLAALRVGDRLRVGTAVVEVSGIGKECHDRCAIFVQAGDCVMPREGVFARVVRSGTAAPGDIVERDAELIRAAVMTVSDRSSRGERADASGPAVARLLTGLPAAVEQQVVVPDERDVIRRALCYFADVLRLDLVVTTGGTGVAPRDVTPDATRDVIDREVPGLAEAMRAESRKRVPTAVLSRAVAGIRGTTLIVNLPGSPGGAGDNLNVILPVLPHAVEKIRGGGGDCTPEAR
jgi:molybdopterin adenylyltransferase